MTTDKPHPRVADDPQPRTTDKTQDSGKSAVKDRKASPGARYAHADHPSAEGNDPSHAAGKTITRRVPKK